MRRESWCRKRSSWREGLEGVAIVISDSDDFYEESSSSSGSEYLPSGGEDPVEEFEEPEPVAGPSRPDTSRPVGVVAPERRANSSERSVSPAGSLAVEQPKRLLHVQGMRPTGTYIIEMTWLSWKPG